MGNCDRRVSLNEMEMEMEVAVIIIRFYMFLEVLHDEKYFELWRYQSGLGVWERSSLLIS